MKKLILPLLIAALAMPVAALACPGGKGMGDGKGGSHFQKMDSNGDGAISAEEHEAMAAERFAAMDTNGDGKVTSDEMKSRWKAKHAKNCPLKGDCPQGKDCPMKGDCPAGKDCPKNRGA
ncbi:MAG TPA: hypothetical protein VKA23_05885 [Mariprofundaceae bacterium]|nr:hypothetical protein [Mariprofundaceae bacterium]